MRTQKRLALLSLIAAAASAPACKETSGTHEEADDGEGHVVARHAPQAEFYAADTQYLNKNATFFFRVWDEAFTRKLDQLPAKGEVADDRKPHSGGYYAQHDDGTNKIVAGNLSPVQKYDRAFHPGQTVAADWEHLNHGTGEAGYPNWAGHCNGYSAATTRHWKEPFKNVTRGGVTFAPQDVKALLAEIHMSADYEFLGGNRCDVGREQDVPTPMDRPAGKKTEMGACEDINPGTLHAAITNWIGRMHHPLIMDMYSGEQVWNYPLWKYQVLTNTTVTAAQARQYVTGGGGAYEFNPAAVKFAYVQMRLSYTEASTEEMLGQFYTKDMDLSYVLEMNGDGDIVGGEWAAGESQKRHPDFLWVALEPMEPNGTKYMGNPNLDNREVIKLWAESVGADPANPPLDIKRPAGSDDWGKWGTFEITLDGNGHGAVFAGKKAVLKIKRKEGLASGNVTLDVGLNGKVISTQTPTAPDLKVDFDPLVGMNKLQFVWRKDGTIVENQALRFHVVR